MDVTENPPVTPLTAEEIEQQQIQAAANRDPLESATLLFTLYYPRFCAALDTLPAKSVRRLIRAIIGVPLAEATPNLKRPEERTAYAIAERLKEANLIITLDTLYKHQQELKKLDDSTESPAP